MSAITAPDKDAQKIAKDQNDGSIKDLTGAQKGLLFILSLDEAVASRVLSNLSEEEVRLLRRATDEIREVSPLVVQAVHREFTARAQQGPSPTLKGSSAYLRKIASKAFGDARVAVLWDDRRRKKEQRPALDKFDAATIYALLEEEQPQTVAVVLSQIEPTKAADIMRRMPVERQAQIVYRIAKLQVVQDDVIREIQAQFEEEAENIGDVEDRPLGGVDVASQLVKKLGNENSQAVISEVASTDANIAESLRKALFTFEDLLRVDQRGMQALLKAVSTDQLIVALKTASVELREKVLGNLSSRAASMLREELDMLGPVRISDVEAAQAAIVETCLTLEQEGKIQVTREGSAEFV